MTLFRLSLRSHLGGLVLVTAISVFAGVANALGYVQIAGVTPEERAVFARQMEILGRQLTYMLPLPLELDTLAGYLHWRFYGFAPIVYAVWALIAASGAGRGDEERGLVEQWLAAGVSRARYLATRAAAFATAAAASVLIQAVATYASAQAAGDPVAAGPLLLQAVPLGALTVSVFGIALVVAQVSTTRRAAGGSAAILVTALFLVNSASRNETLTQVEWLSPFWLYDRSAPLLSAGSLDGGATAALLLIAVLGIAVAAWAFAERDLGASVLRPAAGTAAPSYRPSGDPLLRMPVLAGLDRQRAWIAGWTLATIALATYLVSLTRTMVDAMLEIPGMQQYFDRLGAPTYDAFVSVIWGSTALFIFAIFAILQVGGWVSDDPEGRLEAALAQPVARSTVVLERAAGLLVASSILVLGGSLAVAAAASASDIALSRDRFIVGTLLMPAVPFAFGAVGALIAAWRPRLAVPILSVFAVIGYFTQQFAPLFDWPRWVDRTSVFALYGTPFSADVDVAGISILIGGSAVALALAVAAMRRRDVGT